MVEGISFGGIVGLQKINHCSFMQLVLFLTISLRMLLLTLLIVMGTSD